MHNSGDELHNSNDLDLMWLEAIDLSPDDEVAGGPEIYYFTDENGNIHSHEFFAQELIPDEHAIDGSLEGNQAKNFKN